MSQRLIRPGLLMFRGRPLVPIGYDKKGSPILPIAGGAEDDDGGGEDDSGDDDPEDDTDDDDSGDDEDEDDNEGKKSKKKKEGDDDEPVEKWKYDKLHTRMQAADRRASDLQKQLEELKDKKDINAEVKSENAELKAQNEKLTRDNGDLKVRLAFFTVNTIEWVDAEAALKLLDLSEVEIDDSGKVDQRALRSAIRDLAKTKTYLVKPKADNSDDDTGTTASGTKMAGKRKGQKTISDRTALAKNFPALNQATPIQ